MSRLRTAESSCDDDDDDEEEEEEGEEAAEVVDEEKLDEENSDLTSMGEKYADLLHSAEEIKRYEVADALRNSIPNPQLLDEMKEGDADDDGSGPLSLSSSSLPPPRNNRAAVASVESECLNRLKKIEEDARKMRSDADCSAMSSEAVSYVLNDVFHLMDRVKVGIYHTHKSAYFPPPAPTPVVPGGSHRYWRLG